MNENNNETDQNTELENHLNDIEKKAIKKGSKKGAKLAGKLIKKGVKALIKVAKYVIKIILTILGPYILVILGIILLAYLAYDIVFETRGTEQSYQMQEPKEDNAVGKDEKGEYKALGLSKGNKLIQAFYTYFSDKSYFVTVEDDKTLYKAEDPKLPKGEDGKPIKDKYEREKMFYLNPNALWTLDEFLNNNKFRFPEQFVQPVYHDPDSFELKQLTDDKGNLVAESQKYDSKTHSPIEKKKEKGVWDYGFAPILHYKKFEENKEGRGEISYTDVWDKDKQQVVKQEIDINKRKQHTKKIPGYPKTVWMIDKVTSSAGTITNEITVEDADTGERYEEKIPFKQKVDKCRTVTKSKDVRDGKGNVTGKKSYQKKEWYKEEITMFKYAEGTVWEKIPRYSSDPDTSQITGNKYFKDYMHNYMAYVPENVMTEFNFKDRTGKDEKELNDLIKADEVDANGTAGQAVTMDMSNFKLGEGASSECFKKAVQNYLPIFQKYGNMYGIDPYILIAKACQESGADHEGSLPGGKNYNGAAVGIMQVESPGSVITGVKAWNFQTNSEEYMPISSASDVSDVDANIKAGTMEFASRLADNQYNVPLSIQAYNYGPGGIGAVLSLYSSATGKSADQIKKNPSDTGWLAYRQEVHKNPSKYFSWSGGTFGDPLYVEHVLRYYASPETKSPWVKKKDGSVVMSSQDFNVGSASGLSMSNIASNLNSWLVSIWDKIRDNFNKLFPEVPKELPKERVKFNNYILENRTQDIINMMFVMEEKKYFSEYGEMTDEIWKQKYAQLFKNPLGAYWQDKNTGINPSEYFPNGYESPVKIEPATIVKGYGNVVNGENKEFHTGVDVMAPKGTAIYAVADGTVNTVKKKDSKYGNYIQIDHGNSVSTLYGSLDTIKVKEKESVKKGQQIGTAGNTGSDKGYVLHFELIKGGSSIDGSWIITGEGVNNVASGPMSIKGSEKAQQIYGIMKSFLGSWYAWGGTTPPRQINGVWEQPRGTGRYVGGREVKIPGFDCSGLMYYAFNKAGVKLPRTASEQQDASAKVSKSQAQPGDLLFWGSPAHHVAMYIGNNQYIEAPRTGKPVRISNANWSNVTNIGRILK